MKRNKMAIVLQTQIVPMKSRKNDSAFFSIQHFSFHKYKWWIGEKKI